MTDEQTAVDIKFEEYTGDEPAFIPEGIILPQFQLDPLNVFKAQPSNGYSFDAPKPIERTVVINIETTGLAPYNSRITAICCKDASNEDSELIVWISENEFEMLSSFFEWFAASGYNILVGYNVAFDLRFLMVKAMSYGFQAADLFNIKLDDLAETMKQVRHKYTFGFNKPYKLSDWARYFLNEEQPIDTKGLLTAWAKQDYAAVVDYVERQVDWTYKIWAMNKFVLDEMQEPPERSTEQLLEVVPEQAADGVSFTLQPKEQEETQSAEEPLIAQCSKCLSEVIIPVGLQTAVCSICGEIVTR